MSWVLRPRRSAAALVAGACLALITLPGARFVASAWVDVIVRSESADHAAAVVARAGGHTTLPLPIVNGVAARVPSAGLASVEAAPGVRAVTPNAAVRFLGDTSQSSVNSVFTREINADWLHRDGLTGRGVRVALIDTGVTPVADLADRLVSVPDPRVPGFMQRCVNFSGESTCDDSYGHGTFVAGLIAGTGALSNGLYTGVAPGADVVSIKIAGRDGSADVSKVLAAIQWVVSFREQLNIRVLNLSLGTDSRVSARIDPLNYAVQQAWRSGIVVVVAASNRGPDPQTISKPGDDPMVITVGAVDDRETPAIDDDRLPRFSGRGPTAADGLAKPDVVAPGGRVVSLRAPGSTIDAIPAVAAGGINQWYRRGSGTSMSTAIVSGATALLLQANPTWTPNRVKFALVQTARKVAERDPMGVGAGLIDLKAARRAPEGTANKDVFLSDGSGSIEGSRGTVYVRNECASTDTSSMSCNAVVAGEDTAQGKDWDGSSYTSTEWTGSSWYTSQWNMLGSSWYGSSWYGSSWYGSSWYGSSWYGSYDNTSYGTSLAGSSWYGAWE